MSIPRLKSYLMMFAAVLMLGQVVAAQAEEALPDFTTLVEQASPHGGQHQYQAEAA